MSNRNNPSPSRSMQIKDSRKLLDEGKGLITMSVSTAQARSIIEKTWSSDSQKIKNIREENNDIPNSTFQSLSVKERKRRNDIMAGIQRAVKDTQTVLPALFGTGFGEQHLNLFTNKLPYAYTYAKSVDDYDSEVFPERQNYNNDRTYYNSSIVTLEMSD